MQMAVKADCEEQVIRKLNIWKEGLERKGARGNLSETKLKVGGEWHNILRNIGKWPCVVCGKAATRYSASNTRSGCI